ncbi:hypothetical protein SAMN02745866_03134 [Alteromonadaceae bacterium Bs31]|nr:hypothetical protein SAMN02745866_03134 [Alteromonadaceae bacterium Bs31]
MRVSLAISLLVTTLLFVELTEACELLEGRSTPELRISSRTLITQNSYNYQLLKLALQKTKQDFGPCEPKLIVTNLPRSRLLMKMNRGELIDTTPLNVSKERDESLLPVPFPVYRGMMGYRILLTRASPPPALSKAESVVDLTQFTFGVGENWLDKEVLTHNGLSTVEGLNVSTLYEMLKQKRFDVLLRGSHEVIADKQRVSHEGTRPEDKLVVAYPMPVNFYVRRGNITLATRLLAGLERAQQDGSIDNFFYKTPLVKQTLEYMQLMQRKFIYLCNPSLQRDTGINIDSQWLIPWPSKIKKCQNNYIQHASKG